MDNITEDSISIISGYDNLDFTVNWTNMFTETNSPNRRIRPRETSFPPKKNNFRKIEIEIFLFVKF